jgi:glycerol uptake facilitator-like aquaporin
VLTFLLLFVIAAVATGERVEPPVTVGIAVGGTIAMASLVGGPASGASLNPARSLGPAVVSAELDGLWIYLTAPFVGGVLGAFAYRLLRREAGSAATRG